MAVKRRRLERGGERGIVLELKDRNQRSISTLSALGECHEQSISKYLTQSTNSTRHVLLSCGRYLLSWVAQNMQPILFKTFYAESHSMNVQ